MRIWQYLLRTTICSMALIIISTTWSVLQANTVGHRNTTEAANKTNSDSYLLKPQGVYTVGYRDAFFINNNLCPDKFYQKNINEEDFSPHNKEHCHEIVLRAYYPSLMSYNPKDAYYAPYVIARNQWLKKQHQLSAEEITKLNTLLKVKTYTKENIDPTKEKFPVIVFLPGSGAPAQAYNNLISNWVSNGYVVIGVNSFFMNGGLQLENGRMVMPPDSYPDKYARNENLSDLKYVLDHLKEIAHNPQVRR